MVLRKSQEYGFNPLHVPYVPRAPRSARRRVPDRKKNEDSQICAFELLASLAGKLLQESESCSTSSIVSRTNEGPATSCDVFKQDQGEDNMLKTDSIDHGSYEGNAIPPDITTASDDQKHLIKETSRADNDLIVERSSVITNSSSSAKASNYAKSVISKSKTSCSNLPCKFEDASPVSQENGYVRNVISKQKDVDGVETGGLTTCNISGSEDPMEMCMKFPASVNTDNNVKLASCGDPVSNASILRLRNDFRLGFRRVDEKFSRCNKSGTKPRAFRHPSRLGGRRIRKLLTSKYWKVAPKLKDCGLSRVDFLDGGIKPLFSKRKICYSGGRYQYDTSYKRRKFPDHSLAVTSDGGFSSESVCNSPEKVHGVSSSSKRHQASFNSKDSHVRFSIKSFRIPEFFIEVPETATVGSLKRTVMETLTAILGGGLRVGLVLHGKKVRDNNTTLLQTGITSKEDLDSLGFTLEPSPGQAPQTICTENLPVPLSCDTSQLVSRSPATPVLDSGNSGFFDSFSNPPPLTNPSDNIDSNHELASSYTDKITDKSPSDSRALVAVSSVNADALTVVPVNQKTRRSEIVQRRARRPFSVSEVEALVQAVEELGTGRWRDVKLRSFENADHRTYVDLKDKWKTLVHTAKIAPQQRRGEPVPQQLLDRVLAAHAYWSQHQAKHHSKNQPGVLKITHGHCGRNGMEAISM